MDPAGEDGSPAFHEFVSTGDEFQHGKPHHRQEDESLGIPHSRLSPDRIPHHREMSPHPRNPMPGEERGTVFIGCVDQASPPGQGEEEIPRRGSIHP